MPPYTQRATHCFALNGDIFNPRVNGLNEACATYQNAIRNANLYGPTYFSEILEQIVSLAEHEKVSQYK